MSEYRNADSQQLPQKLMNGCDVLALSKDQSDRLLGYVDLGREDLQSRTRGSSATEPLMQKTHEVT